MAGFGQGQAEVEEHVAELLEVARRPARDGRGRSPGHFFGREGRGHGHVGGDHELLDQPVGLVPLGGGDRQELAGLGR